MINLLVRVFELSARTKWLKTIDKAIKKRNKLRDKLLRQNYVVTQLVTEYKKRYPNDLESEGQK